MTDEDTEIRFSALDSLRKIRSSDPLVVKALGHSVRAEMDVQCACFAATALKELGPPAATAVPDLIQSLEARNPDGTFIAATAPAVKPSWGVGTALQRAEIEALGNIGAPARNAIPLLRRYLTDNGPNMLAKRVFSAKALWQITGKTDEALRALINALEKQNSFWVPDILANMGAAAKPAIPALQAALHSPLPETRAAAALALRKIDK